MSHCPDERLAEELHFPNLIDDKHLPAAAASIRRTNLEMNDADITWSSGAQANDYFVIN